MSADYYIDMTDFLYDKAMNERSCAKIVYSAMHGVGSNFIDKAFAAAGLQPVHHVKQQRGED